jgi:hypothetical protein
MLPEENSYNIQVPRGAPRWQHTSRWNLWQQIYRWGEESAREMGIESETEVDELVHRFRREQTET